MKRLYILITILFLNTFGFSQFDKFGMSKRSLINSIESEPCEVHDATVIYCVEDGSKIGYAFENDEVFGIQFLTIFISRYKADQELEKLIDNFSIKNNLKPRYDQGKAFFVSEYNPVVVSFYVVEINNSYYAVANYTKFR